MIIRHISLYQYDIPLTSLLPVGKQRIDHRQGLVLEITAADALDCCQHTELVEISPLSGNDINASPITAFSRESLTEVIDYLLALAPTLRNKELELLESIADECSLPSAAFGLSLIYQKLTGVLAGARQAHCAIQSQVVPLIYLKNETHAAPDQALTQSISHQLSQYNADIQRVKVKVGQVDSQLEIKLIYGILSLFPKMLLRLDANRAFTLDQAIDFCASLPKDNIEYIEEPCINPEDNLSFYQALAIPYGLDETLHDPTYQFEAMEGLVALVIKPMLLGSLNKLANLINDADTQGVQCVLSSALESSLGISDLAILASVLTPDSSPGLDTLSSFKQDLIVRSNKLACLTAQDLNLLLAK